MFAAHILAADGPIAALIFNFFSCDNRGLKSTGPPSIHEQ